MYFMAVLPEVIFILDLILAIALGFLLGRDREMRHKDAGVSTITFVVLGSMLFTFLSGRVDESTTTRIAASIITGVGFLGAGIIIQRENTVKNLTTAAGIWFAAGVGMAIGFGYYMIAVIATAAGLIVPQLPHCKDYIERHEKEEVRLF
jgi:putative Mg2+ transporter-C (MgtC) family protein